MPVAGYVLCIVYVVSHWTHPLTAGLDPVRGWCINEGTVNLSVDKTALDECVLQCTSGHFYSMLNKSGLVSARSLNSAIDVLVHVCVCMCKVSCHCVINMTAPVAGDATKRLSLKVLIGQQKVALLNIVDSHPESLLRTHNLVICMLIISHCNSEGSLHSVFCLQ